MHQFEPALVVHSNAAISPMGRNCFPYCGAARADATIKLASYAVLLGGVIISGLSIRKLAAHDPAASTRTASGEDQSRSNRMLASTPP